MYNITRPKKTKKKVNYFDAILALLGTNRAVKLLIILGIIWHTNKKHIPKLKTLFKQQRKLIIGLLVGILIGSLLALMTLKFLPSIEIKPATNELNIKQMAWNIAAEQHVDPLLLFKLIKQESAWRTKVISPKGAVGLMQIMPKTAKEFCNLEQEQLFEPILNLKCGTAYLVHQLQTFGSVELALCAYNAGPHRVKKLGRCPKFKETQTYVEKILGEN